MDDREITKKILPLYQQGNQILIGLEIDFLQEKVKDGLTLLIDLKRKEIINQPWSGQKIIKHGYWDAVEKNDRVIVLEEIYQAMGNEQVNEIIDLLLNPPKSSIESLTWIPERLLYL